MFCASLSLGFVLEIWDFAGVANGIVVMVYQRYLCVGDGFVIVVCNSGVGFGRLSVGFLCYVVSRDVVPALCAFILICSRGTYILCWWVMLRGDFFLIAIFFV